MEPVYNIVSKAAEIESQAAYNYLFGLSRLRSLGYKDPKLEESIKKIAVETIIHKHVIEGLMRAFKELEKIDQSFSSLGERGVTSDTMSSEARILLKRFAEMHLSIEKDMIETYKKLSEEADHPLVKKIAESLVENEEQHHRYLSGLISELQS